MNSVNWSRWVRVAIGIAFVGEAVHSGVWIFGFIGTVLMIQGAMNTGCNSNCEIK